ncbi:MAG: hypothetical protein GX882_04645, partial [Methanomicrobiales archaeon]|nr:hypothetical protein [Methanomicrobiales archaeon]
MIRLFAIFNGTILNDDQNWSPTYTRIRFLLSGLARYEDITVGSISFGLLPGKGIPARIYSDAIKIAVALRFAYRLIKDRLLAFFAYLHSLMMFQNRHLFRLCVIYRIPTVIDIHDTRE